MVRQSRVFFHPKYGCRYIKNLHSKQQAIPRLLVRERLRDPPYIPPPPLETGILLPTFDITSTLAPLILSDLLQRFTFPTLSPITFPYNAFTDQNFGNAPDILYLVVRTLILQQLSTILHLLGSGRKSTIWYEGRV